MARHCEWYPTQSADAVAQCVSPNKHGRYVVPDVDTEPADDVDAEPAHDAGTHCAHAVGTHCAHAVAECDFPDPVTHGDVALPVTGCANADSRAGTHGRHAVADRPDAISNVVPYSDCAVPDTDTDVGPGGSH